HEAELDAPLAAVLDVTRRWAPWGQVRAVAAGAMAATDGGGDSGDGDGVPHDAEPQHGEPHHAEPHDAEAIDETLLAMIDDGLLHADVVPPLLGPPAGPWMRARLRALGRAQIEGALEAALGALEAGDLEGGRRALGDCPGG